MTGVQTCALPIYGTGSIDPLPVQESDFVFAALVRSFGAFGGLLIIALLGLIVIRLIWHAWEAEDRFGIVLAGGLAAIFLVHDEEIGERAPDICTYPRPAHYAMSSTSEGSDGAAVATAHRMLSCTTASAWSGSRASHASKNTW